MCTALREVPNGFCSQRPSLPGRLAGARAGRRSAACRRRARDAGTSRGARIATRNSNMQKAMIAAMSMSCPYPDSPSQYLGASARLQRADLQRCSVRGRARFPPPSAGGSRCRGCGVAAGRPCAAATSPSRRRRSPAREHGADAQVHRLDAGSRCLHRLRSRRPLPVPPPRYARARQRSVQRKPSSICAGRGTRRPEQR